MSTPSIRNIDSISTSTKRTRLIHFTTKQWEKAVKDIPVEDFDTRRHGKLSGLIAWQDPEQVIVFPACDPPPGEICLMHQISEPGFRLSLKCECRSDGRGMPGGGGPSRQPASLPECFWMIVKGKLTCIGKCNGKCRAVIVKQSFAGFINLMVVCRCVK